MIAIHRNLLIDIDIPYGIKHRGDLSLNQVMGLRVLFCGSTDLLTDCDLNDNQDLFFHR